jgi:hypothetical protein
MLTFVSSFPLLLEMDKIIYPNLKHEFALKNTLVKSVQWNVENDLGADVANQTMITITTENEKLFSNHSSCYLDNNTYNFLFVNSSYASLTLKMDYQANIIIMCKTEELFLIMKDTEVLITFTSDLFEP